MIKHFLKKISKLKIKHLKDSGNQKAFKGVPKQKTIYFKALQKETKPVKNDTRYIKHYWKH